MWKNKMRHISVQVIQVSPYKLWIWKSNQGIFLVKHMRNYYKNIINIKVGLSSSRKFGLICLIESHC